MIRQLETQLEQNLRRWQEVGEPYRWVETHRGRWNHEDWLSLLADLARSGYWPVDPAAVSQVLEESRRRYWNLRRWQESGESRRWVDERAGHWDHEDWLALLGQLRLSPFWPLEPAAVGAVLLDVQQEWRNLERWQQSSQAREWVEAKQGNWGLEDWMALWPELQQSEFWPLNPEKAESVLRRLTAEWWNLRRWQRTGQPRLWVQAHEGKWAHEDWLELLESLEQSQFWPLDPAAVGRVLEEARGNHGNLLRWQQSEAPQFWVDAKAGRWNDADWRLLLSELSQSSYWPLDPDMVEVVVEECRNLRRWQESSDPRRWVDARGGRWDRDDWLALLGQLQESSFWPLDPAAVGRWLLRLNVEWWNLRRWRMSGLARLWVESHQGEWSCHDRQALWLWLSASEFWPIHPESLDRVLIEVKSECNREQTAAVREAA